MTTLTSSAPFSVESTLGEIVAARPALARVFERLGLDYCCGGKQTLAAACARKGLKPEAVIELVTLEAAATANRTDGSREDAINAAHLSLTQLADHIEATHHAYVKTELPRLAEMAERVARKHGWRDARLPGVWQLVLELGNEMFSHMQKEERVLFPFVRQIDQDPTSGFHCGSIANPIRQMEAEHEIAGNAVARLRELTDGFTPDAESCNTHRGLLAGLAEFESDLHLHVHKENNILFPRALERAAQAGA